VIAQAREVGGLCAIDVIEEQSQKVPSPSLVRPAGSSSDVIEEQTAVGQNNLVPPS